MTEKKGASPEKEQTFERSMERRAKIVAEMEGGSLGLDEMIRRFEEGQKLIGYCSRKLNEVERKVEMLVKKESGAITTEPFPEGEEVGDQ